VEGAHLTCGWKKKEGEKHVERSGRFEPSPSMKGGTLGGSTTKERGCPEESTQTLILFGIGTLNASKRGGGGQERDIIRRPSSGGKISIRMDSNYKKNGQGGSRKKEERGHSIYTSSNKGGFSPLLPNCRWGGTKEGRKPGCLVWWSDKAKW